MASSKFLRGPASVTLVVLMLGGCLFLWIGVPLVWLWIGSQLQTSAPVGTALMVTILGAVVSIVCLVPLLGWLNRQHLELKAARGLPIGDTSALEVMLVVTAAVAMRRLRRLVLRLLRLEPVPLNVGY